MWSATTLRSFAIAATAALFAMSSTLLAETAPASMVAAAGRLSGPDMAAVREQSVSFKGRVVDSTWLPVAGVRITAQAVDSGSAAGAAISDRYGRFAFDLAAGTYLLRVGLEGVTENVQRVVLKAGDLEVHDFVLRLPALQDAITVQAPGASASPVVTSGTRTPTALQDVPQSITVVTQQLMRDQLMTSIGDVVRYLPGITLHQGENNRDQVVMRGNSSSADFFVDGIRDDVQYYRDLYNLDRVEALKGPNAMIFGRGGGGGVINRVTKEAIFGSLREVELRAGSHHHQRVAVDFGQAFGDRLALRVNGLYEDSGSFRDGVDLQRSGVAPTFTLLPNDRTKITLGYEHFRDLRVADRGISSYRGRPAEIDIRTFYGNSDDSRVRAAVDLGALGIEHRRGGLTLRNRTLWGDYQRFYQNYVPGAVSADRSRVALSAYNNATDRRNLFNQTDLILVANAGQVRHTLLVGAEIGRQRTDNFRNTGFFGGTATAISVPYGEPTIDTPVEFRQNSTDADNRVRANVAAVYVQDQIELSPRLQLLAGMRFDRFDLEYDNHRGGERLSRVDDLVSPRAGIVFKPIAPLSLYGSYSVSYLPSSGDQFSSLTVITRQAEPEQFSNYEIGAKWDALDALSLTAAVYQLDRTHTRATDPNDPTRIVQTGSQRTRGYELGANGRLTASWSIAGGYAYQDAVVTSATVAARAGARVAQVPRHSLSLWNNYQVGPRLAAGLGVVCRSAMFATIDDTVTLPGYARLDAALYFPLRDGVRLQLNVENILNTRYWANADSNTNITPGSPRAARVGVTGRF